jgi:hypothetical protein
MGNMIYGVRYHDGQDTWYAFIHADDQSSALDVLWDAIISGADLLDNVGQTITVEKVEPVGLAQELPFPEMIPPEPVVLAVMRLAGARGEQQ